MVGIVVVSHSEPLAVAAVELAMQMVGSDPPPVEVAAGNDGGLGTDAVAVAAAIQRADAASSGTGVLVVTDLGSAVMSSELALELLEDVSGDVRLSRAPFVEGLVAAVVQASLGSSLDAVEREATGAMRAKTAQLAGGDEPSAEDGAAEASTEGAAPDGEQSDVQTEEESDNQTEEQSEEQSDVQTEEQSDVQTMEVVIVNPEGLHARPAVLLAKAAAELSVDVSITNLDSGAGPASADSMLELMSLGVRQGNRVRLSAEGGEARDALEILAALIAAGLGEGTGAGAPPSLS